VIKKALKAGAGSVEEILLLGIILLNFMDFIEHISPDLDYVKKIISLSALGVLMYKASPTKIFFGNKQPFPDVMLVISYLLLSVKDMLSYSVSAITDLTERGVSYWGNVYAAGSAPNPIDIASTAGNVSIDAVQKIPVGPELSSLVREFTFSGFPPQANEVFIRVHSDSSSALFLIEPKYFMHRWHNVLLEHSASIEVGALLIGVAILLVLSIYFTFRANISSPSLLHAIREEGSLTWKKIVTRTLIIFLVLNFFYVAVFNLMLEWLALAIDAPLLMIAIFFYFFAWLKHHRKFASQSLLYRIGNFGESFYEKFIAMFHDNRGIMLGLSGMLVLHLATDIGNYLVPYITGIHDPFYFAHLGSGHTTLFSFTNMQDSLAGMDLARVSGFGKIAVFFTYMMNAMGVLLIFIGRIKNYKFVVLIRLIRFYFVVKLVVGIVFTINTWI